MRVGPSSAPPLRRLVFGGLAAFILLAPALPQIFGVYSPLFRPWVMYSGVGIGLLRGEIVIDAETSTRLTPEAFLSVTYYPQTMSIRDAHVILDERAFKNRMAVYCADNLDTRALSFDGELSGLKGWRSISVEHECTR